MAARTKLRESDGALLAAKKKVARLKRNCRVPTKAESGSRHLGHKHGTWEEHEEPRPIHWDNSGE